MPLNFSEWERIKSGQDYQQMSEADRFTVKRNWALMRLQDDEDFKSMPEDSRNAVLNKAVQYGGDISIPSPDVAPERGFVGDIGSRLARGGADLAEQVGGALRMADFNPESDEGFLGSVGQKLQDQVKKWRERSEILKPDVSEATGQEGFVKRGVAGGAESLVPSLAPVAAGALGGLAFGPIGAILAGGATLFSTFGLGQYQSTYDQTKNELISKGVPEQEAIQKAKDNALISATAEVGFEAGSDLLTAGFFKVFGGKVVSQPIKKTIKEILGDTGKEFGKAMAKSLPTEVGSEMATAGIQASSAQRAGIDTMTPLEAMGESILPAVFLSVGMGSALHGINKINAKQIYSNLNNIEDPARRKEAINSISSRLDKETGDKWNQIASSYISQNKPIEISKPLVDFTIQKIDQDINNGDEVPLSPDIQRRQQNQVQIESTDLETGRVSPNIRNQAIIEKQMPDLESIDYAPTVQGKVQVAQAQVDQSTSPEMFTNKKPSERIATFQSSLKERALSEAEANKQGPVDLSRLQTQYGKNQEYRPDIDRLRQRLSPSIRPEITQQSEVIQNGEERQGQGQTETGLLNQPVPSEMAAPVTDTTTDTVSDKTPIVGPAQAESTSQSHNKTEQVQDLAVAKSATTEKQPWVMTQDEFEADKQPKTYGDWYTTPDGKMGQMRGSGGLGSKRVRMYDVNNKFIGHYNADELKLLRKSHRTTSSEIAADEWHKNVTGEIGRLKKENESLLLNKGLYDRFKRAVKDGEITEERFKKKQADGEIISDEQYLKALDVEKKIDEVRKTPLEVPKNEEYEKYLKQQKGPKNVQTVQTQVTPEQQATTEAGASKEAQKSETAAEYTKPLNEITVKTKAVRAKTGKTVTITEKADVALADSQARVDRLSKMLDCVTR